MKNFFKRSVVTCIIGLGLAASANAETITVTNTNANGSGSLHQAILDANANPSPTTIKFNLGANNVITVPVTGLPEVTTSVKIQGESLGNVVLQGASINGPGGAEPALNFATSAGNSVVRYVIFKNFLFAIESNVGGMNISNNRFEESQGVDVRLYGGGTNVNNNEFVETSNGGILGVQVMSGSNQNTFTNNVFEGTSLVMSSSSGNTVGEENKGNVFKNTSNEGVFISGSGNEIHYNTFENTSNDAIEVNGNGNNITFNIIDGAGDDGIEANGIQNTVSDNQIKNVINWDVNAKGSWYSHILRNSIEGSGPINRGIYVESAQAYKIKENTIKEGQIYVKGSASSPQYGSFEIDNNIISNDPFGFSGHGAIQLENTSGLRVEGNNIHDNASHGIYIVDGADHYITKNRIVESGRSAIRIIGAADVEASQNVTYANHSDAYNGHTAISGSLKDAPVITGVQVVGGNIVISGTVNSTGFNTIEVFLSDAQSTNFTQNAYQFLGSVVSNAGSWSVSIPKNGYTGDEIHFIASATESNNTSTLSQRFTLSSMFTQYRTYTGVNNNLVNLNYGKAGNQFVRAVSAEYGSANPFNALGGENRASAREVSNIVADQPVRKNSTLDLSSLVYAWGQFIDHDIDLTAESHDEPAPIPVNPQTDVMDLPISFSRSAAHPGTGITNDREHTNLISSWVDASMVYGADVQRSQWLRTFQEGKLKTSAGDLLPYNTVTGEYGDAIDLSAPGMAGDDSKTQKLFVAGDVRANEQAGLTSLHTLFVREHNRICDEYKAIGYSDDEQIYQMTRKKVGAMIQKITFEDWLPAMGVDLDTYTGYNSNVMPDITNEFATAAFRIGHTMLQDELLLLDDNLDDVEGGVLLLKDAFFRPDNVSRLGIEPILKGLAYETQQEVDEQLVDAVRNFLFVQPGFTFGFDLAAINIQRGRDHGLADYNEIRNTYVGNKVTSFAQINSDATVANKLNTAYSNVNDIDAWMGMLAEEHLPNSTFGPTIHAILKDQFGKLRDADQFYYKNDAFMFPHEKTEVDNTTLGNVLERNTGNSFRENVFFNADPAARIASTQEEIASDAVVIYPNPSAGEFTIDAVLDETSDVTIEVYSVIGELVFSTEEYQVSNLTTEVSLQGQPTGVYLVKVITTQGTHTEKVIVE